MFSKIQHNLTILAAKKILDSNHSLHLSTAKRFISIIAGAYIFSKGLRSITKHPVLGIQETILGGFLLLDAVKDIKNTYPRKPRELNEVRRNQIQGNDPDCAVPAFV